MIVDFHTHIFPEAIAARTIASLGEKAGVKAATDGTVQGLLASMNDPLDRTEGGADKGRDGETEKGADLSVIMPVVTKPSQFDSINEYAAWVNREYRGRLISFGGIHPDCADYKKKLDRIRELGLPGIKLHPDYQGVMIDDVRYMDIMEYADELGLMILIHAGIDIGLPDPVHCPPDRMRKVLDRLKPKRMILAHLGGWKQWDEVYEYLAGTDVWLDTAFIFDYITEDMFLKIAKKHGTDRILFATDSPWSSAPDGIEAVRRLPLLTKEKEDILGGNAERLLTENPCISSGDSV